MSRTCGGPENAHRRDVLRRLALGLAAVPLASLPQRAPAAAAATLLSEDDPLAKAQGYVADAHRAKGAQGGALCSNCSIYGGVPGTDSGPCMIFPGKLVKAAGWCKAWSSL
jgi:hypothetical protein